MVEIPPALLDAIRKQRAVLFFGAGASRKAKHPEGIPIPQGSQLLEMICDKFLNEESKGSSLSHVAAMAASEAGLIQFQEYIRELFLPFEPADFHLLIPKFRWRAIATTNFDLIIERAYESAPDPLQDLVKTVKDDDKFEERLLRETDPIEFYKLHGCIDHFKDLEIPLTLGDEQYASYDTNRKGLYDRFSERGENYPVIFVGYSISDPHIQRILFDLTDANFQRQPFYRLSPGTNKYEDRYWTQHRVFTIAATFEEFLNTLDKEISPISRKFPIGSGGGTLSIREYYLRPDPYEPPSVDKYLTNGAEHIHSELSSTWQDPREFYRGYDDGWGCIVQNLDARRTFSDSVLVDAVLLEEEERQPAELFMLKGPGGNGKTVSLKRIAWEAGVEYNKLVLFPDGAAGLNIEPLLEIHRLTGERIFLFVDRVALVRNELNDLMREAQRRAIPISVIGAERDNEWNIYCEQLEPFVRQEFPVQYLNEGEIRALLVLLELHNSLGSLRELSFEDRVKKFVEIAGRQLLVALHELTQGKPFEEIVVDEYQRIEPELARNLYLDICALHQFGAPVRAGLISRASGIRFEQFQREFLQPLENVVHVVEDSPHRDVQYRSRHQHVAEIVFYRILTSAEDRYDLLARLLKAINVGYSSDNETFSRLIKGRGIAEVFPNVDLGRLFYDRVEAAVPDSSFLLHQRAVFEIQHRDGSLEYAEAVIARASELNPKSQSIRHTQAEIARRMANATDDPLLKQSLRRTARDKLSKTTGYTSEYDFYTLGRLSLDEFRELSALLDMPDNGSPPSDFFTAARDTEATIQRGLQRFPESSQLLSIEAEFREWLDQTALALQALERAFRLNPRQDWIAVRLALMYQNSGDLQKSQDVLNACLQDNPSSRSVHLELGRVLIAVGDGDRAIEHLRRSFVPGDNRYDARFWCARELFLQEQFEEADELFKALHAQAPGRFRTRPTGTVQKHGVAVVYECLVKRKEEGYAFLSLPHFSMGIFASRADSNASEWGKLDKRVRAKCNLAFTRRGPRAISIRLED